MTDSKHSLPSSSVSRTGRMQKVDLKKLSMQHDSLMTRVNGLREALSEKDILIKSQRNTIKLYEQQIESLDQHKSTLKHIIGILSSYILQDLNEALPPLPPMPEEETFTRFDPINLIKNREHTPIRKSKNHKSKRTASIEAVSALNTFTAAHKQNNIKPRSILFDENLKTNMYQDFNGAEFLKNILDVQLCREQMKKVIKFLLGKTSKDVFLFKTRTILFESLSLFLSLRNVAFLNNIEVFLPRVLEMMIDIIEVDRVILYVYDPKEGSYFSKIVTCESPSQIIVDKTLGHFKIAEQALVISKACEDPRFDAKYDRITGFITTNLACVPVKIGEELLGLLECSNKNTEFTKEDVLLLSQISKQIAIGLSGEQIKEKKNELYTNAGISGHIQQSKDILLVPILDSIVQSTKSIINCERVTIYIHDENTNELVSIIASDLSGTVRVPIYKGLASLAFTSNMIINIENASNHTSFNPDVDRKTGYVTKEVLAIKIGSLGVVQCLNKCNLTAFTKTDESRLAAVCEVLKTLFESGDHLQGVLTNSDINEMCLQAVREAILQVSSDGLLLKANKFAAKVFQLSPERMAGATIGEIFEESEDLLIKFMQAVREQSTVTYKDQKIISNGKYLKVDVSFLSIKSPSAGNFYIIFLKPT
jgi:putative methionine-R-sulfoxide reductase with GAF domain